jgi:hypothetical protein
MSRCILVPHDPRQLRLFGFVRNVQLSPAVRMGHFKALVMTSCKYPIRRIEVKVDTVPSGNMNYIQGNMFLGHFRHIRSQIESK